MNEFPILLPLDPADAAGLADFHRVAAAALDFDGYAPFNEQALFDLGAGRRTGYLVRVAATVAGEGVPGETTDSLIVGAALGGRGEIDLAISPEYRRRGYGRRAARELVDASPTDLSAWAHGDHPGARSLAGELRFVAARTLLEMRMPLTPMVVGDTATAGVPGMTISAFRVGVDEAEWVALNASIFAAHPEQGGITEADLAARQAESWFAPDDFLILRDSNDRMIGYNWLKIEGTLGEIYVIGVKADAAGQGLGRVLMQAGLARMVATGCTTAALYVEADSLGPVHLYRTLGFVDHTIDVQYQRLVG